MARFRAVRGCPERLSRSFRQTLPHQRYVEFFDRKEDVDRISRPERE